MQNNSPTIDGGAKPTSPLQKSPRVEIISLQKANELLQYHYLGPIKSAQFCVGHDEGCCVFGVLRSRTLHKNLIEAGFNPIELIRMVGTPKHLFAMSSLLSHGTNVLFKNTSFDIVVTYYDREMGHTGNSYKAANWLQVEDAMPDGYLWRLDGKRVSRKRFYKEFGSSSIPLVKAHYGDRLTLVSDVPKKRFIKVKDNARLQEALAGCKNVKNWGQDRVLKLNVG